MDATLQTVWIWVTTYTVRIIVALLIFIVGRWISQNIANLLDAALKKQSVEQTLIHFLRNLVYYALLVAVAIAAFNQAGISTASFLTIVGAAGLAIGLALKDSLGNFSAGVMLILFKPFKSGDYVLAGGTSGTVQEINIFNTILTTPDNQKVIVPNSSVIGNNITNVTANATRRLDLVAGIGYADDIDTAKQVLHDIIAAEPRILPEPAVTIAVSELGDSSVNLVIRPWVKTEEYWAVRFDLIEKIKKEFDRAGITIPFPQRDVHMYMEQESVQ